MYALADRVEAATDRILEENAKDLAAMDPSNPKYDRLKLTAERIHAIAQGIRQVATLPSPSGRILSEAVRPNGMKLTKVSVPFGVIGIIYEARPNVTLDVFALCFKSGNACILKGGSDADFSNRILVEIIRNTLLDVAHLSPYLVALLPAGHDSADALLHARGYVDLIIPRGGKGLMRLCAAERHDSRYRDRSRCVSRFILTRMVMWRKEPPLSATPRHAVSACAMPWTV